MQQITSAHTKTVSRKPTLENCIIVLDTALVGPPKSVTAANISTTRIDLQWEPPFDPEDLIDSYSITYQLINTSFPFSVPRPPVTITNIVGTSFTLQPLLESSVYRIVVTAVAGNTTSPGSDPIVVSTAEPGKSECMLHYCITVSIVLQNQ